MNNEFVSFGCRLNIYESELIKRATSKAGLTDSIIFNSQRKVTVKNDVERALEWESPAIVGIAIDSIATGNTTTIECTNHGLVIGDVITISNSGFAILDGNLFFVGNLINENAFTLYHVNTTSEASIIMNEGAKLFTLNDGNSTLLNITNIEGNNIAVTSDSTDDVRHGYTLYVDCMFEPGFFATVNSEKVNNAFTIQESGHDACTYGFAHRIDKSIGHDISIIDKMEYYGGYVKVHTTKRHGIQEGDTVILGGIKAAGWSDLNGSPFLVEKTTKTTITLENSTAVINMGNAVD